MPLIQTIKQSSPHFFATSLRHLSLQQQKRSLYIAINQTQPEIGQIYKKLLYRSVKDPAISCNFISQVVDHWAESTPKKSAIHCIDLDSNEQEEISFGTLVEKSYQIANFYEKQDFKKGDSVALMLGQRPAWWYGLAGLIRQGIAVVPCPRLLTANDLLYRINHLKIRGIITAPELESRIDSIRGQCPSLMSTVTTGKRNSSWTSIEDIFNQKPTFTKVKTTTDDPCIYLYTSGTTGQPKAVTHHHDYPFFHLPTGRQWLRATPNDLVYNASDTGWGFTVWITTAVWAMGAKLLVTPTSQKFDPQKMLAILRDQPVTIFCAAPTVLRRLVAEPNFDSYHFAKLKRIVTVGEALDETVIDRFAAKGIEIAVGFGQAETPLLMGRVDDEPHIRNTMGKPIPPYKIVVLDDQFQPLPPGNMGQLAVELPEGKNMGIMRGYDSSPDKTRNAYSPNGSHYLTGDYGEYRLDGFFSYSGRKDDLMKINGYTIGPDEVEKPGMSHPAVAKIAVIAVPTKPGSLAKIMKAYILLKPNFTESPELIKDIQNHIKTETAPHKYPRRIKILSAEEWGKYETTSGKIRRDGLRKLDAEQTAAIVPPAEDTPTLSMTKP